jgi:hypothetical protein
MAQRQTTQGTPAAVALPAVGANGALKSPLVSGGIAPVRNIAQLSETDANRDQGVSYVSSVQANGSPQIYGRDGSIGMWLQAALGADAVTGSAPNYVHTLTPANTIPYLTCWRDVSDTLWESFVDCKVSSLVIAAAAGQPLTVTPTIIGRTPTRLAADPSTAPVIPLDSSYVYNYNDAVVTLSGGVTAMVGQFSLTIDNSVVAQQTDNVVPMDVTEGLRKFTLAFDLIFADLTEYNKFNYGSAAGTTATNSIYTTSADFLFTHGTNNSIEFSLPSIAYDTFPVDVNAAGNPITVSVTAVGQRGGSPILTSIVKNQIALY